MGRLAAWLAAALATGAAGALAHHAPVVLIPAGAARAAVQAYLGAFATGGTAYAAAPRRPALCAVITLALGAVAAGNAALLAGGFPESWAGFLAGAVGGASPLASCLAVRGLRARHAFVFPSR